MSHIKCTATDYFTLSTRKVTDEGFLIARGNIARTGTQDYRRGELGLEGNPLAIFRLYRPDDEVFAPDSMATFEGKAITIDHPPDGVNASNWRVLAVGDVRDIKRAGQMMDAEMHFRSADAIKAINDGKSQLSNGYTFDLDLTPGTAPDGSPYDGVQRNIRGNHVALVDAARCGSACRVGDSQTTGVPPMSTQKITVDGIPLEVSDTAAAVLVKMQATNADLTASLKMANDGLTKMVSKEAHDAVVLQLEQAKKDAMTPAARDAMVADWAGMLISAKRLAPAVVTDGKTCHAVRKEVLSTLSAADAAVKGMVGAVLGAIDVDAASEDDVRKAFNAVAAMTPAKDAKAPAARQASDAATAAALLGQDSAQNGGTPPLVGRAKAMADQLARQNKQ